jgi:hypothetical protein
MAVACGVAALSLLGGARAEACLGASEDLKVLLGETDEGLVWAVLKVWRSEDDKDERTFWWRLKGHVEVAPSDGGAAKVVPGFKALSKEFKSQQGRKAHYEPPITKYVDSLAARIKLPGFRRPQALRQYSCDHVRACGPWLLRMEKKSLVATRGEELRAVVATKKQFADAEDPESLPKDFRLMEVREYELAAATVFVLNLAVGDYHATYGEDEPPDTTKPGPMKLTRECQGVACYRPMDPMHHGYHFEASVALPTRR